MTSAEIQLNPALEAAGIGAIETDLAELILQLGDDEPSHIVVPALHVNRRQVREIFARRMGLPELSDDPRPDRRCPHLSAQKIPECADGDQRSQFPDRRNRLRRHRGVGRQRTHVPHAAATLIALAGIEKVLPRFADLEVMLQVLARSATGERMNPYTSLWSGVTAGDGPQRFHVVLLDNGRSDILGAKSSDRRCNAFAAAHA